jgi:hypothetical protein
MVLRHLRALVRVASASQSSSISARPSDLSVTTQRRLAICRFYVAHVLAFLDYAFLHMIRMVPNG